MQPASKGIFYLDYVLGLGSHSLVGFAQCPQLLQNQRYSSNTIGQTLPTKQKLLELADPWIGSADFYVCFIGSLSCTVVFVPCLQLICNQR